MPEVALRRPIHSQCLNQSFSPMPMFKPPVLACPLVRLSLLEHLDALYRYALALTELRTEAEDLVQETCLRALRAEAQFRPGGSLKSWLFTILRHVFLNQKRSRQARAVTLSLEAREAPEAVWRNARTEDPHTMLVQQVERTQVQAALAALAIQDREVLVLREWEGLSYEEIAEVLHCPIGTVMSRLGRARERLRAVLE